MRILLALVFVLVGCSENPEKRARMNDAADTLIFGGPPSNISQGADIRLLKKEIKELDERVKALEKK